MLNALDVAILPILYLRFVASAAANGNSGNFDSTRRHYVNTVAANAVPANDIILSRKSRGLIHGRVYTPAIDETVRKDANNNNIESLTGISYEWTSQLYHLPRNTSIQTGCCIKTMQFANTTICVQTVTKTALNGREMNKLRVLIKNIDPDNPIIALDALNDNFSCQDDTFTGHHQQLQCIRRRYLNVSKSRFFNVTFVINHEKFNDKNQVTGGGEIIVKLSDTYKKTPQSVVRVRFKEPFTTDVAKKRESSSSSAAATSSHTTKHKNIKNWHRLFRGKYEVMVVNFNDSCHNVPDYDVNFKAAFQYFNDGTASKSSIWHEYCNRAEDEKCKWMTTTRVTRNSIDMSFNRCDDRENASISSSKASTVNNLHNRSKLTPPGQSILNHNGSCNSAIWCPKMEECSQICLP